MRLKHLLGALIAVAVGSTLLARSDDVAARQPAKAKKPKVAAEPAAITKAPALKPAGLTFGQSPKEVAKAYEKAIDEEYLPRYQKTEPGIQMQRLEEEISRAKEDIRLSYVSLDAPPSSLDGTNLVGEFTYGNDEGIMRVARKGKKRTIFFIRQKVWKVVDAYELSEKGTWGADFKAGVQRLEKMVGAEGRPLAADPAAGRTYDEVDWADPTTHLRAINWDKQLAIAYVEIATEKRLAELRQAKDGKKDDLSPGVKEYLR